MSILLNALKKSEAQRQLGQIPGIHTNVELPTGDDVSDRHWIPLLMLGLSAVAIAWFTWQQYRAPSPLSVTPQGTSAELVEETPNEVASPVDEPPPRTAVESFEQEKKGLSGLTIPPPGGLQVNAQNMQRLNQSFKAYESEGGQDIDENARTSQLKAKPESPGEGLEDSIASGESPAQAQTDPSQRRRTSRMEPHQTEPISYWQVPQALRDGLPEIRITVLVYADAPEDRFVLISGVRLVENDELAPGVLLDEIRRDGVVFRYRNYRFLVKG